MTARHCVPGMSQGDPVSSPATLELAARFQYIVRYTRCQPESFQRQAAAKDQEAVQLLHRHRLVDHADGVECMTEGNLRSVMLEGPRIGALERVFFGIRHDYMPPTTPV